MTEGTESSGPSVIGKEPAVPFISTDQMREVDRAMVEDYGILLLQMMENAGRALAYLARGRFLGGDARGRSVGVVAGRGGNGGGGLVCARRLHGWGADVRVWLTAEVSRLDDVARRQACILQRMGVPVETVNTEARLPPTDVIIDALIGYGLSGPTRGATGALIQAGNSHAAPVLALDVPSGVDADAGTVHDPAVAADATLTLALPKRGLRSEAARKYVGDLYLADIGVPLGLYSRPPLRLDVGDLFAKEDIIRLW